MASAVTGSWWPVNRWTTSCFFRSHRRTSRSSPAVSKKSPSGEWVSARTSPWWASNWARSRPVGTSHRRTEPSRLPLATEVPLGWNDRHSTASAWRGRESPRKRVTSLGRRAGTLGSANRARMYSAWASTSLPDFSACAARSASASARSISSGEVIATAPDSTARARSAWKLAATWATVSAVGVHELRPADARPGGDGKSHQQQARSRDAGGARRGASLLEPVHGESPGAGRLTAGPGQTPFYSRRGPWRRGC